MSPESWLGLVGVFIGGALPWLEAVVVIPAGILAGLPTVPVVVAGTVGNLLTVGIAAYAGEWLKEQWSAWRDRRKGATAADQAPEVETPRAEKAAKRRARIERLMSRGGLPLLALVGPVGVGTQLAAVIAAAAGARATPSFLWIGGSTVLWCIVAAVATLAGFELFGMSS